MASERILDYQPLAKSIASRYRSLPYEDRVQEAMLGLVIADSTYDEAKGQFGPYARVIITQRLNAYYLHEVNSAQPSEVDEKEGVVEERFEKIEAKRTMNQFAKNRSKEERRLLRLRIKGLSQAECAKLLGVSQPTVNRMLARLKEEYASATC